MKKLITTRAWILLCYILAVTNASPGHQSHVLPNHGHPRSILPAVPPTIRIPEKILPGLEDVSCVSANINIFDILNEAKQYSKGNDLHIKLYYYSNQKYYAIGEINVNKELFDRILMKYDDWLITGERISDNNTVTNLPDHILEILKDKVKNANETAEDTDKITDLVAPDNQNNRLRVDEVLDSYRNSQKNNDEIDSQAFENNRETLTQEKSEKIINTAESKDNIENYLNLNPKYDDKNKYFEVSLPKDGTEGKESTINLEIDNGRNNFPYTKQKQNEPDNALDNNLFPTVYKDENETNVMTQTVPEYGKTYVDNESVHNNNEVGTIVNTDFASETNDGKPEIYSTKYETINYDSNNNKQNVIDSESNNDIIKSTNFKGNMPNTINSFKTNNDRSMQNDQGSNFKLHLNLNDLHKNKGNHDVSHSLKHEDKNHITEVLHHNPNENIYNTDDIFEDHVSKLGLQINGENPYIYNPHDFEDTHEITLQDKDENHIHLNEKVYKIHGLNSESDHKNGSYTIKIPKLYSSCPQTLLQYDHEPYLDSSGPNQPSQFNVEDSLTSNLVIPPIGNNMDSGELSRSMKPNSQAQATTSSVQDVPKYYKEDFTKQSPLDTNLGYQSLPNSCQDSFRLLSSPLKNTGSQNTPLNLGYAGFPSYSQLNNPSIRLVPNKKLFTDRNSQQSDSLPSINDNKIIVDTNSESICNNNMISVTDINANYKHPSFVVGSKESSFTIKQPLEASSMPIETTSELLSPHQSSILDGTYSSIFNKPTLGIDSSISNIPCRSEIGIVPPNSEAISPFTNPNLESLKSSMDAIPKDVNIQTLLDIIKQHPYVLNPKLIQQYVPNLSPVSQQVCQTPASSSPLNFEEIKPIPNSQLPLNLLWNNPRQYICPSNLFSNPSTYPINLQRYPAQKSAIGIPQFQNLQIPSPLVLNNNFNHYDSTGSQEDVLEPSLGNSGSILNKPISYEPCFANLPSQLLPSERPFSFTEIGNGPCFNVPSNKDNLVKPNQNLTPLSKIPTELMDQPSQVNSKLLSNEIPIGHDITYLDDSLSSSTANTKLSKGIQSANSIDDIPFNPTDSNKKYAPMEYLDSSLLPPSILTPCLNNAIKSPLLFPSTKIPNCLQEPNYLDSSLLPPSVPLPCLNPELESQKAIYSPQNKQFKMDDSIRGPSPLSLKPIPSKLANYQAAPYSYLDSSLIPPSLPPYFTPELKTQHVQGITQYGTDSQITVLPDYIHKQLSALGLKPTVHLQPKTSSYISPSQEYLKSKLLPHNVFSPCFNSEIKTPPSFQDILSQSGAQTELVDYLSQKPLILNPMMYSRPKIPKFIQVPPQNYLDSSLLPPSLISPYLNNVIENPLNIEDITQYGSDSQFKLADILNSKTSPGQKPTLHVPPITANYVPTTQEYLGYSLLPPNILSPCLKSEIDTLSSLSNIQSYQPGDNVSKKLIPSSLHPMLPKIGKYIGPPVDYLDSTLLPPSILPPCNPGIQTSSSMETSNYYSEVSTGVENNLKQRPLNLKQPTEYSPSKMPNNNQDLPHQIAIEGSIDNVEICNTPLDAIAPNHYPMLTLQNSEIIRGPSPCAQQVSPLGICEKLSVQPEIPSLYNVPSLVAAFPNIFAPKTLQSNAGVSHLSSLSPDVNIDYTPSVFNSIKLSSPAYSQIDNQIIPLTSPTICPEFSSNTASSFPHTNTFDSYPNIHLPSSLIGPSLKPLLWPNIPTKYPFGRFLPPNILPTSLLPQANSWNEGISNNIIQEIPEFTPLSFSTDLTSIPRYYSPHISEALENLYDLPTSPNFINKPLISQQKFNPYALIPIPHHDFTPNSPQTFPSSQYIENISSSFIPCPTSSYTPLPGNVLQAKPLATNPWFTLESDQPTSPQNINVESMLSQPSFKSTAYNSQVNNKEYLSAPKHNIGITSESPCESLPSHLTNPSLVSIIDAIPSTEEGVNLSAPISDISSSTDSFSELNTCSYTEIDVQQNNVNKSTPIKSDSINMELTISEANGLIPLSESGPCSEQGLTFVDQPNLQQNIGKSMIHDKLTSDLKITGIEDYTNAIDTQNFTPIQSEFIENNLKVNKSYKVVPPTTQLYENTNQYELEAATDVLSLHQSSIINDEINILPSSLIPGSSIVSNTQEMPTFNIDVSSDKKSSPYTTLDTSHVIPIKSHTTLSSDLQPPSISDLEHSTSGSNDFIAKEFIPLDNIPFLDTTLEGSSLPSIISRPSSTQSSKYSISSIDRNMPHDFRTKSLTLPKEYLKDSGSYQMLEESPPTYQYIPSSIDNILPQSVFSGTILSNQPPCNLQRPSTVSYIESQFASSILPTYDTQDSNLPCNFPTHMLQKPESFETLIPYTLQPEHNFHSNAELSKKIPYNIPNIPENFVTLPYSESISNGLYPYEPLYSQPCGLGTFPSTTPMPRPPSFYNPQAIFAHLESNTPNYKPMFGLEKPVSELQPCRQQVQPIVAEKIPYSTVPTHIYQPAEVLPISPCAIEKSTLSTNNIYLPTPFEISPSESLYSSEYLPPIVPPKKSIPKLKIPSYPELQFSRPSEKYSYHDTTSSSILNIPNNQYKISDDIIKDSRYTLPDLESLGISDTQLVPISVSSPQNKDRFITSSIALQRNINPLKPPCRIPGLDQKLLTLPYARPESLTYTSLPYQYLPVNVRPASSSQPRYIQPMSSSLTPKMIPISQSLPQYTSPVSQSYYSLPVQPNFIKPQSTVTKPISQAYLKPSGAFTRPQFSVDSIPISPTYSTLSAATTPIVSASTGPSRFTQFSTKPQFSVISSPCSQSYTTILPDTAPILKTSTIPFTPSSTSTNIPCKKTIFSYKTPTPNYISPLSESYSYLPVTTNSFSPFIQPSTGIPKPYIPTPTSPILSPKSNIVPQNSALLAECINAVFLENKAIQNNPFIEIKKYSPLPSCLPNQLYALPKSNILLKPYQQPLTFTHQATNRIPKNSVLYPKNIPKPEFIQHLPQSMMFSPPLYYAKPERISIKGPLSISNNICQESYETEKDFTKNLNIPLQENPIEIVESIEAIINENTKLNTVPIPINSMSISSLKKYTPSSKLLFTTSGYGLPYSYPIVPGFPVDTPQLTLSTTSSALTPCISASISLAPMLTSETLPNVLEYPYNMAPVDIRQKPLLVDKQPNRYDSALPSTLTPTSELVSLPYTLLPNLAASPKLSSTSSSYIPPPVTYAEQVPGPLISSVTLPSTPSYIKYSTPMSIPAKKSPLYYSSQKQMPISSQYLKPCSPLQIQELPINNLTPILRPCYSPFSVPSSTTSPFSNIDVKNPDLTRYLSPINTTPQSTVNNVVPTNEFESTQIQEIPISSQYLPCPLSPQDNLIEIKSPLIEPLVSESLLCKESLDTLQTPPTNIMSALSVAFNKDIQFTPITQPCSSRYRQVDMPKELKDLLQKISRPRPEVPNYQYPISCPFSKNLFGQILLQPIQDKPLSNLDVSEYQTLPLSAGIPINQPTLQWLSATGINNLQNLISNPCKPSLPQYTISNSPIYGTAISSLHAPKILNSLSSISKTSYIPLSESSSTDFKSSDLEYSDASQANPLTKAVAAKPCISLINKPLTCSYASQGTPSLQYFRQPSAKVPTESNIFQGLPKQYPLKPNFGEPKWFSLQSLPFVGKNNQFIPFKPLPSSLQGPSVLGTEFEDIGTVPISNDVEWISALLQGKNIIPQKAVLHPKNIPKHEFIEYSPQPMTFSPLLNTGKPANLAINEAIFSSHNICQENFETGKDESKVLNIPSEESPIRIVEDIESIINENTKSNFVPIPISAKPYFNHQLSTPCSFKQFKPYSKLPYTTYTPNSYQIFPTQSPVEYTKAQPTVPIPSSSISPAESLSLLEDVAISPSNIQPCSQIKPSQGNIDQSQLNIMPAYQQFIAPQFIPAIMSPYSYTSKLNPAENQLPIPSISENKRPQPTYPYTTPDIWVNASPSQLQSPLSYTQPYILSDIHKLLGPIAKPSPSSPKYKNLVSYSSEIPSDFEVSSSSGLTPQYTQVNPYQPLLAALNKGLKLQATNYPHYLPCDESQSEGYDYVQPVPATTRPSPALTEVFSSSVADIPIKTNEDILPNSLQNPKLATILGQYNLPSFISPYTSPTQQYVPLNIFSSSYLQPPSTSSILSGVPQSPSYNAYPESLQSLSCQSMRPPKTQKWSSLPELVKSGPLTIQPNWWYQNGPIRAPFIKPNVENPCKFNTFTPYENMETSSEITTPQYENTISEGSYDYPKENTVYFNLDKYTEVPSNNELNENSVPTDKSIIYSDIKDYNEEYYTDVDLNPYEDLNNLQGPNPDCKYSFKQPLISAPFSKIVPEDFISALNIPNMEDDSCKDSVVDFVKLPPYVYNRNLPKYLPLNAVISKTGYKIPTGPIRPIEYETSSDEIQEPTPFELYANLNNAPNQGKYYDNNRFPNKPQDFFNQPFYKPIPIELYRNSASPFKICNEFTEIPSNQYQYYPQLLPNFSKNTYPQTSNPQIASNAQILALDPDTLLVNSNDYSKVTPCDIYKPYQVGNIKYSGYKTYQMPNLNPNVYQELPIMNEPKTTQTISNIADYEIPIQNSLLTPNLDLVNWQQSSNLNEGDLNNLPVGTENEIKTNLINHLKLRDQKLGPDAKELTIPIRKFAIVKPVPCSEHMIKTKNPSLDLKVWKSNIKVVEAEIRLRFKDLSVINFMPIVNNLDDYDIEEIKKIVKDYINEKYGEHYDVSEPYAHNNEYAVIKELDKDFKNSKYNLLWPTKCVNA